MRLVGHVGHDRSVLTTHVTNVSIMLQQHMDYLDMPHLALHLGKQKGATTNASTVLCYFCGCRHIIHASLGLCLLG